MFILWKMSQFLSVINVLEGILPLENCCAVRKYVIVSGVVYYVYFVYILNYLEFKKS